MLDFADPEAVSQEIERAEKLADAHAQVTDDLVSGYAGSFYRGDQAPDEENPENAAFEYAALVLPLLVYDNPACMIESRKVTTDAQTAQGMEEALNGWIVENDLQSVLELAAIDYLFSHGVLLTTFEPYGGGARGGGAPPLLSPRVHYLSPKRFFLDPNAVARLLDGEGYDSLGFMGHKCVRARASLEKNPAFDKAVLASLSDDAGIDELDRPGGSGAAGETPTRSEIVYYELWVPPESYDPQADFNGKIYTVGWKQGGNGKREEAQWLRKPRPFYGPPWGPYTMVGAYPVPGQCYPLSPIAATAATAKELNAHANAASRAAGREKSLTLINASEQATGKAIKQGKDGEVLLVPNLTQNSVVQLELGGVSAQRYEYLQTLRERNDRDSGVNQTRRGNVTGNELATAINSANSANSLRDAFIKMKFTKGVAQVLRTAAWYFHKSNQVVRPLSPAAGERLGMRYPVFHGGPQDGQEAQSFDDLGLRIEPYSMERPNEAQLQTLTLQLVEWLTGMAEKMPQLLWIDFEEMMNMVGKVFNMRSLQRLFLPDRLAAVQQAMAKAAAGGPPKKTPVETINYKDTPSDVQRQLEAQAGLQPSRIGVTADQVVKLHQQKRDTAAATVDHVVKLHMQQRDAETRAAEPVKDRERGEAGA